MQFFAYYVLWPFVGGSGFCYFGIMQPDFMWWFLGLWFLPWLTWPVGRYRRRYIDAIVESFKKDTDEAGEANTFAAMAIGLGPTAIMILSSLLGVTLTPIYMEEVLSIDVPARIEEIQERGKSHRH